MFLRSDTRKMALEMETFKRQILQALGENLEQELSNDQLLEMVRTKSAATASHSSGSGTATRADTPTHPDPPGNAEFVLDGYKLELPTYSGVSEEYDAFQFLDDLRDFAEEKKINDEQLLKYVLPKALKKESRDWFNYRKPFDDWQNFREAFLEEHFSYNYELELNTKIAGSFQAPDEPLGVFIRKIASYYKRLKAPPTQEMQCEFIISRCHPSFRHHLSFSAIKDLRTLQSKARHIQQVLLQDRIYALEAERKHKPCNPLEKLGSNYDLAEPKRLNESALDPAFVKRNKGKVADGQNRDVPGASNRSKRRCFICNSVSHIAKFCDVKRDARDKGACFARKVKGKEENKKESIREPLVSVNMRGLTVQSYLDSGSNVGLVDEALCKVLEKRGVKRRFCNDKILLATGEAHAKGKISLFIYLKGRRVRTTLYVLPGLQHSLVLARDFISGSRIAVRLHLNGWNFETQSRVYLFEETREACWRQGNFSLNPKQQQEFQDNGARTKDDSLGREKPLFYPIHLKDKRDQETMQASKMNQERDDQCSNKKKNGGSRRERFWRTQSKYKGLQKKGDDNKLVGSQQKHTPLNRWAWKRRHRENVREGKASKRRRRKKSKEKGASNPTDSSPRSQTDENNADIQVLQTDPHIKSSQQWTDKTKKNRQTHANNLTKLSNN